ncbi:MAG: PDZ domain-containing protein, partial [Acidobacteria bacterium]|nr:PDZ domain-containing protein [Acidobacteriota bacterium]
SEELPVFLKSIADLPAGTQLEMTYLRDGEEGKASVTTEALESEPRDESAFRLWGFTARELSPRLRARRRLESAGGVYVSGIRPGGPAQLAEPPVTAGDVLLSLGGRKLVSLEDLRDLYEEFLGSSQEQPELVAELEREGNSLLTLLRPKADDDEEAPRELPKAWLAAATQPLLLRLSEMLGFGGKAGFRVTRVYPGTRAADSDLQVGDVIVALDGEALSPRGMQDSGLLNRRIQRLDIGGEARLTVLRGEESREIAVPLDRSRITPQEARRDQDREFELEVRELTFFDRDERQWEDGVDGVLVDSVEPAGWAGLSGLRPGDLVQRFGGKAVKGISSYRQALAAVKESKPERIVVFVLRHGRRQYLSLEPDWGR